MSSPSSTTSIHQKKPLDPRQRFILQLLRIIISLSPVLPLVALFLFVWIPQNLDEKFYLDEHAFPIRNLQYAKQIKESDRVIAANVDHDKKNNRESYGEKTIFHQNNIDDEFHKTFKPLDSSPSSCFHYAVKSNSASTFATNDIEPVVVMFTSSSETINASKWFALELFQNRYLSGEESNSSSSSPLKQLAVSIASPIIVLVAENRNDECLRNTFATKNNENRFFKTLSRVAGGDGGNFKLFTIVDLNSDDDQIFNAVHQSSTSLTDFCIDARTGEATMPNLDAVVMHARIGTGSSTHHHHHFVSRNEVRTFGKGVHPTLYPTCFRKTLKEDGFKVLSSSLNKIAPQVSSSVDEFKRFILSLLPKSMKFFINDLLSTISLIVRSEVENENNDSSLTFIQRRIHARTNTPTIALRSTFRPEEGNIIPIDSSSALLSKRFSNFLDGLFLQTYSFTFIHERLHHSQLGYLFTSPDSFVSVNHLQLIVFSVVICSGLIQLMYRGLEFYLKFFSPSSEKSSSSPFHLLIAAAVVFSSIYIPIWQNGTVRKVTLWNVCSLFPLACLPSRGDLSLFFFSTESVRCAVRLVASLIGATILPILLTFNFPLALALSVPYALILAFSVSEKRFKVLAFSFGTAANDEEEEEEKEKKQNSSSVDRIENFIVRFVRLVLCGGAAICGMILLSPVLHVELDASYLASYLVGPMISTLCAGVVWV